MLIIYIIPSKNSQNCLVLMKIFEEFTLRLSTTSQEYNILKWWVLKTKQKTETPILKLDLYLGLLKSAKLIIQNV